MRIVAFAGPSLPASARSAFDGVEWRPPAQAGDLLGLKGGPGLTVCLIDGYFDHRPAVRHKELLLLLSEGTRILGASSIGALRAAEMHGFGMIGVGRIFEAYRRGTVTGDDEVALIHTGEDRDWRQLSVPLVDVRATLWRARREGTVGRSGARALLSAARAVHYVERDWQAVLDNAGAGHEAFAAWLPANQVEQKKIDALECVEAALRQSNRVRRRPPLVRSVFLDVLARECGINLETRCEEDVSSANRGAFSIVDRGNRSDLFKKGG